MARAHAKKRSKVALQGEPITLTLPRFQRLAERGRFLRSKSGKNDRKCSGATTHLR